MECDREAIDACALENILCYKKISLRCAVQSTRFVPTKTDTPPATPFAEEDSSGQSTA